MNSLSVDIASWETTEKLLKKYPTLTEKNLARYRLELNHLLDNPDVPDDAVEHYVANLDKTYNT
jgi:hypothetical protein